MTNALGHKLAQAVGDVETLGAYRRGNRLPWVPGAVIDVWAPCPRGEIITGVPTPHVFFKTIIPTDGSIHCPTCREELAVIRAGGKTSTAPSAPPQSDLPF